MGKVGKRGGGGGSSPMLRGEFNAVVSMLMSVPGSSIRSRNARPGKLFQIFPDRPAGPRVSLSSSCSRSVRMERFCVDTYDTKLKPSVNKKMETDYVEFVGPCHERVKSDPLFFGFIRTVHGKVVDGHSGATNSARDTLRTR